MKIRTFATLVLLPTVGLLACAERGDEGAAGEMEMAMAFDETAARAAIAELQAAFLGAAESADAAALAALYSEDATVMPPNAAAVEGRAAIEAFWAGFMEGVEGLTLNTLEVGGGGDVAYEVGEYTATIAGETDQGVYVVIYKRAADGSWKLHRDIFHSDLPLD